MTMYEVSSRLMATCSGKSPALSRCFSVQGYVDVYLKENSRRMRYDNKFMRKTLRAYIVQSLHSYHLDTKCGGRTKRMKLDEAICVEARENIRATS